jgi:hypothetical protein
VEVTVNTRNAIFTDEERTLASRGWALYQEQINGSDGIMSLFDLLPTDSRAALEQKPGKWGTIERFDAARADFNELVAILFKLSLRPIVEDNPFHGVHGPAELVYEIDRETYSMFLRVKHYLNMFSDIWKRDGFDSPEAMVFVVRLAHYVNTEAWEEFDPQLKGTIKGFHGLRVQRFFEKVVAQEG